VPSSSSLEKRGWSIQVQAPFLDAWTVLWVVR